MKPTATSQMKAGTLLAGLPGNSVAMAMGAVSIDAEGGGLESSGGYGGHCGCLCRVLCDHFSLYQESWSSVIQFVK